MVWEFSNFGCWYTIDRQDNLAGPFGETIKSIQFKLCRIESCLVIASVGGVKHTKLDEENQTEWHFSKKLTTSIARLICRLSREGTMEGSLPIGARTLPLAFVEPSAAETVAVCLVQCSDKHRGQSQNRTPHCTVSRPDHPIFIELFRLNRFAQSTKEVRKGFVRKHQRLSAF